MLTFSTPEKCEERLAICKKCDSLEALKSLELCKECGCVVYLKVKLEHSECPKGKW